MNQVLRGQNSTRVVRPSSENSKLSREMARQLQSDLNALGYKAGPPDGVIGRNSRAAIASLFADAGVQPPNDLTTIAGWVRRATEQQETNESDIPVAASYIRGVADGYSTRLAENRRTAVTTRRASSTRPQPAAIQVGAAVATSRASAVPTRKFAGPNEYPPTGFRGYGVIAFKSLATDFDRLRHNIICEAYIAALVPNALEKSRNIDKFVTIWPVANEEKSRLLNNTPVSRRGELCSEAIVHYNAQLADDAIRAARRAGFKDTGRGPFFLGWLPSDGYGKEDALVIVMDMSLVETYSQAEALIAEWKLDIQTDPALLKNPYAPEMVRRKIRRWSDKYGYGFLTFIKGS